MYMRRVCRVLHEVKTIVHVGQPHSKYNFLGRWIRCTSSSGETSWTTANEQRPDRETDTINGEGMQ